MTDAATDPLADDAFLGALLDTLIPPGETMPGAGALGLAAGLRKQLSAMPMIAAPASAALAAVRDAARARDPGGLPALDAESREQVLSAVIAQQPALGMLQLFVFTQYYQHPMVLQALGQPAGAPFPEGNEIEPTDPELLAKLTSRRRA
jgi:hypothetical protein